MIPQHCHYRCTTLTMQVFDNNRKLCERINERNIEHMYTLASTYLSDNDEYLEFFKALAVLVKVSHLIV